MIQSDRAHPHRYAVEHLVIIATLIGLVGAHDVIADDRLKDFQTAINYMQDDKGCLSIPYSDLQDGCQRKQAEVNRLCKESGPWNCGDVDPKSTQKKIEALKTEQAALKNAKEDLERQKSSASDDNAKRAIDDKLKDNSSKADALAREHDTLEREVQDGTKAVNDRIYIAKACRDSRSSVHDVFRDAKSRANGESGDEIGPLAKRLVTWWESREAGHEKAIADAKTAAENCDQVLYEIGHLGSF